MIAPQTADANNVPPEPEPILYLPEDLFFVETIELPAELDPDEINNFAELNLEAIAPFPIEQLNWGYLQERETGHIRIYATHRERLKKDGYENLESYTWVLPKFVTHESLADAAPDEQALWQADVRSLEFKKSERKARRTSALLTQATHWTVRLILILVLLELFLFGAHTLLKQLHSKIAEQAPAAARVDDTLSLVNKLENVTQNELRPVAILKALNQLRPSGIYFTGATCDADNQVTLDGISQTISALNQYTSSLTESGNFALTEPAQFITRSGKTTFNVTLKYLHTSEVDEEENNINPQTEEPLQ